ncbi:hypothetical protein [Janthinobacterium psychrotolerans]|uniref:DUF1453 domain-containing protein n=1 Tax=Janthinobacterium psychrotolerans TaxID=1747903 RepID=A0A1A7BX03_9BURK|nr:hypothetical protein [Janthinobacterium psychrotolerans]OBV37025.1 hypothetical protein ASR47_100276 [Janthinobacterium psychrotolerans]
METTTLALLFLVPLLVWRIYSRLKKLVARQKSLVWRHRLVAFGFPALIVFLATTTKFDILPLSSLGAGVLAGGWLGVLGIKLTRFEQVGKDYYFTQHRYLGLAITMLFIARLLYRGMEIYLNTRLDVPVPPPPFGQSPLTMAAYGMVTGYYACYAWGLLRWRQRNKPLDAIE